MSSAAPSFSRIPFRLVISEKGEVRGELVKHLAPFTNAQLIKAGKVEGVITREKEQVVLVAGIKAGLEKSKKEFEAGSVALLPLDGSIRFILTNQSVPRPMNHIGEVKEGMDILAHARSGDRAQLLIEIR
ncbi:MAG: hypothetical protein QXV32_07535 [Conexivisphaerales archaeon]